MKHLSEECVCFLLPPLHTSKGVCGKTLPKGVGLEHFQRGVLTLGGKSQVELTVTKCSTPSFRLTPGKAKGGSPYKKSLRFFKTLDLMKQKSILGVTTIKQVHN